MIATEMSPLQEIVSNIIETDNPQLIDMFIAKLRGHGIDNEDTIEEAYCGCFPSVEVFSENLIEECYHDVINEMPVFLQTAIDYEMVWHQTLQYDYFEVYFNYEYYLFNRNV